MVQKSLVVSVRVRPLLEAEQSKNDQRDILRVLDGKMVIVLDPDERKVRPFTMLYDAWT